MLRTTVKPDSRTQRRRRLYHYRNQGMTQTERAKKRRVGALVLEQFHPDYDPGKSSVAAGDRVSYAP